MATLTSTFWIYSKFEVPAKNVALMINSNWTRIVTNASLGFIAIATLTFVTHMSYIASAMSIIGLIIELTFQAQCMSKVGITDKYLRSVVHKPGEPANFDIQDKSD